MMTLRIGGAILTVSTVTYYNVSVINIEEIKTKLINVLVSFRICSDFAKIPESNVQEFQLVYNINCRIKYTFKVYL